MPAVLPHPLGVQGIRVVNMLEGGMTPMASFGDLKELGFHIVLHPLTGAEPQAAAGFLAAQLLEQLAAFSCGWHARPPTHKARHKARRAEPVLAWSLTLPSLSPRPPLQGCMLLPAR